MSRPDLHFMQRAIDLSARGFPAPNPQVGCVIVKDDEIIGEGHHEFAGGPHAEVLALREAGGRASGATAYVTLEPCNHQGRTPPCVDALLSAGIARVVAACRDPFGPASGGLDRLARHGVAVSSGLLEAEARAVNLPWLRSIERGMPFVVLKAAMTLDGKIAAPGGESKWITGNLARIEAHRLRAECGAVLVGRNTVEKDDPALTVRHVEVINQPLRIVLDPWRKLPLSHKVFDSSSQTIRVVAGEPRQGEIRVTYRKGFLDLHELLRMLFEQGVRSLLVEGGAHTIGAFLAEGLADRLELFLAPKIFGAGTSWVEIPAFTRLEQARHFHLSQVRARGEDLQLTYFPTLA